MILKLTRRFIFRRKNRSNRTITSIDFDTKPPKQVATKRQMPAWEQVLTASLKANALAPAEEVILHAFDLYCEELNAPFNERRRLMSERFSNIAAGFARIQSLAPDMVERAAAKNRLEMNRFINHTGDI